MNHNIDLFVRDKKRSESLVAIKARRRSKRNCIFVIRSSTFSLTDWIMSERIPQKLHLTQPSSYLSVNFSISDLRLVLTATSSRYQTPDSEMFQNHFDNQILILPSFEPSSKSPESITLCLIRLKKFQCTFELHVKVAHNWICHGAKFWEIYNFHPMYNFVKLFWSHTVRLLSSAVLPSDTLML